MRIFSEDFITGIMTSNGYIQLPDNISLSKNNYVILTNSLVRFKHNDILYLTRAIAIYSINLFDTYVIPEIRKCKNTSIYKTLNRIIIYPSQKCNCCNGRIKIPDCFYFNINLQRDLYFGISNNGEQVRVLTRPIVPYSKRIGGRWIDLASP